MLAAKSMYFVNPRCEHVHSNICEAYILHFPALYSGGPKMFSKIRSGRRAIFMVMPIL